MAFLLFSLEFVLSAFALGFGGVFILIALGGTVRGEVIGMSMTSVAGIWGMMIDLRVDFCKWT